MPSSIAEPSSSSANPNVLEEIARSQWRCAILRSFCSLKVADHLASGPKSAGELATDCGTDASLTFRFLRGATMLNVCRQVEGDVFELTPLGEFCRSDHPESMRSLVLLSTSMEHTKCWLELDNVIKTGKPGVKPALGIEKYFDLFDNPQFVKVFEGGMKAMNETPMIIKSNAFAGVRKCVEIGSGHGDLLKAILRKHPEMTGIISDLPEVVKNIEIPEELARRCSAAPCNFLIDDFGAISGADGYVIKHVLHNWSDETCIKLLKGLANCMAPDGKVFIIGAGPVPVNNSPHFSKMLDVCMAVLTGARERTEEEHKYICREAGLSVSHTEVLDGPLFIMTAVKM